MKPAQRERRPWRAADRRAFADAAAEWLRFIEQDRGRKPSTVGGYASIVRTQLLPTFGAMPLQSITADPIDAWLAQTAGSVSSRRKSLVLPHGIFRRARKVWGLRVNPVADVEKPPLARSGDIEVFSPEEVWALVRAAGTELDGTLYLTAAFTGLRMGELLALRWRDIDFAGSTVRVRASFYNGHLTTPKSGKVRAVPLAPDVATALAQLGRRENWVGDDDLVFAGEGGDHLDAGVAPTLQDRSGHSRPPPAALSRPAPHVRHPHDRQGRHPPRPGMDGPRRHPDHDALPPFRAPCRGRRPRR